MGALTRIEGWLDRMELLLTRWWVWPGLLAVLGWCALAGALVASPVGEDVRFFGVDLFGTCTILEQTGEPCASCGMTRSWMWTARGEVLRALRFSVAGTTLFVGLVAAGLVGTVRLVRRRPDWLGGTWPQVMAVVAGWLALYFVSWGLRLAGVYPLP